MVTPTPNKPRTTRRIGDISVQLPVIDKETIGEHHPFMVAKVGNFMGRYGLSWRITCVNIDTGEQYLCLLGSNAVRDSTFSDMAAALTKDSTPIGPVQFEKRRLEKNWTWDIVDVEA